jgi:hypothetical protein
VWIISVFKSKRYFFLAVFFAIFMLGAYPFVQILPQGLNNFWFWFSLLTPIRWILYISYGILFGLTFSFFIARWQSNACDLKEQTKGGLTGFAGGFVGLILPQCAACISIAALFLPLSFALFLTKYTTPLMIIGNLLLLFALYSMGALRRSSAT